MSRRLRFFLWLGLHDGVSYGARHGCVRPTRLGWFVAGLLGLAPQKISWDVEFDEGAR